MKHQIRHRCTDAAYRETLRRMNAGLFMQEAAA